MGELRWTLTYNGQSERLTKDPRGWENLILKHERDELYHAVFYFFSEELAFFCKGAGKTFIDNAYNDKGSEAEVTIKLEYRCGNGFSSLFPGRLNMKSYHQDFIGKTLYTFVNVEKTGITHLVRNREDTKVDLTSRVSLDGSLLNNYTDAPYDLNLHSKVIYLESKWDKDNTDTACTTYSTSSTTAVWSVPEFFMRKGDIHTSNEVDFIFSNTTTIPGNFPIINTSGEEIYILPDTFTVEWDISGIFTDRSNVSLVGDNNCGEGALQMFLRTTGGAPMILSLYYGQTLAQADADGSSVQLAVIPAWAASTSIEIQPFSGSGLVQITLNTGDKLWLVWGFVYNITTGGFIPDITRTWEYNASFLKISIDSTAAPSTAKAIAIHEAWSRLSESITNQTNFAFYSEFFGRGNSQPLNYTSNGCGSFTSITNGLNIRGFEKPIYFAIQSFFSACNVVWNLGLGIERINGQEVIRIEEKNHFYNDTVIFQCLGVSKATMRFDEMKVYNTIEIGYDKWEIEVVNGLDEPMTEAQFALVDIKSIKNNLVQKSTYVAGMYAIELTRRKDSVRFPTEDYQYDNENFFIALNRTVDANGNPSMLNVAEKDENFSNITNLYFPETAYNLRFQLRFLLARWMNMFTGGLTKLAPSLIKPTYTEGNPDCTTTSLTNCRSDAQGISVKNVQEFTYPDANFDSEPLFLPEEYEFDYPVSYSQYVQLIQNPNGVVEWSDRGGTYQGYIKSMSYHLKHKMMHFVLIRKP